MNGNSHEPHFRLLRKEIQKLNEKVYQDSKCNFVLIIFFRYSGAQIPRVLSDRMSRDSHQVNS
jgi:hypothetical protein